MCKEKALRTSDLHLRWKHINLLIWRSQCISDRQKNDENQNDWRFFCCCLQCLLDYGILPCYIIANLAQHRFAKRKRVFKVIWGKIPIMVFHMNSALKCQKISIRFTLISAQELHIYTPCTYVCMLCNHNNHNARSQRKWNAMKEQKRCVYTNNNIISVIHIKNSKNTQLSAKKENRFRLPSESGHIYRSDDNRNKRE